MKMDFAKRVREQRISKGMTQKELGDYLGMSQAHISNRELGNRGFTEGEKALVREVLELDTPPTKESEDNHYTATEVAKLVGITPSLLSVFIHNAIPDEIQLKKEELGASKFHVRYKLNDEDVELFKRINKMRKEYSYPEIKEILAKESKNKPVPEGSSLLETLRRVKQDSQEIAEQEPFEELEPSIDAFSVAIVQKDGEVLVNSREVATNFKKNHQHVLRDIDNIVSRSPKLDSQMFVVSSYENRGKEYPLYLMNRDGFSLLAMGFTGERALQWKLKYIEAFNKMERQLKLDQPSYSIDDPVKRAEAWIAEQKQKEELQLQNAQQKQLIGELQPAADYTDTILQSTNAVTITQIAKDYDMTGHGMNKLLHEMGVQYKVNGQWVVYDKHNGKGFTKSHTHEFDYGNGQIGSVIQTRWTQKGRLFIYNLLREKGIVPLMEQ